MSPGDALAFISSNAATLAQAVLAWHDLGVLLGASHVVAALSYLALGGSPEAFSHRVHVRRPFPGSLRCAAEMRALTSPVTGPPPPGRRLQDPFGLRVFPQVQGPALDALDALEYGAGHRRQRGGGEPADRHRRGDRRPPRPLRDALPGAVDGPPARGGAPRGRAVGGPARRPRGTRADRPGAVPGRRAAGQLGDHDPGVRRPRRPRRDAPRRRPGHHRHRGDLARPRGPRQLRHPGRAQRGGGDRAPTAPCWPASWSARCARCG